MVEINIEKNSDKLNGPDGLLFEEIVDDIFDNIIDLKDVSLNEISFE